MTASESATKNEENAYAQLRYLQNMYSQQYELLEEQIATYSVSLDSIRKGADFLGKTGQANKSKTLVSVGGGAYVEAAFPEIKATLVYVGAGYLVEKGVSEAKEYVEANQKKQELLLGKLDAERRRLQGELINLSYKLESMQARQQ